MDKNQEGLQTVLDDLKSTLQNLWELQMTTEVDTSEWHDFLRMFIVKQEENDQINKSWRIIDKKYKSLITLWKNLPDDYLINFETARITANIINYYILNKRQQQIEDSFKVLQKIYERFSWDNKSLIIWYIAKGMISIIIYYMNLNDKSQVDLIYQDLKKISEHFSGTDFTSQNISRIEYYIFDSQKWRTVEEDTLISWERVNKFCEAIYNKYQVLPQIVETDEEFYSDEIHLRTIKEKQFFISAENPEVTSSITNYLLQQTKLRYELMHSNRIQKASMNSQSLAAQIENIKKEYIASHSGREPSLHRLASILTERNVVSPGGKTSWHAKTVQRILDSNDSSPKGK